MAGQRPPGPFAHFSLSGPHAAARDLVPSLVSVLLKPPVGSVPRALSSFQAGLLLREIQAAMGLINVFALFGAQHGGPGAPQGLS